MRVFAFLAVILLTASLAFAQSVFHPASEVAAGIFGSSVGGGNYTFNNSMFVVDRLGIGTTSPSTALNVNGTLRVDNATGNVVLFANATSGNVGIGTTTPFKKLEVYAAVNDFVSVGVANLPAAGWAGIQFGFGGTTTANYRKSAIVFERNVPGLNAGGKIHILNSPDSAGVASATLADARLTITDTGNVGIGTTSPSQKLDVNGSVNVSGTVYASNISSNSPLQLQTAGTTRLFINDTTGNVGIGTASPTHALNVVGNTNITGSLIVNGINITGSGSGVSVGAIIAFNSATCPTGWILADGTSGTPNLTNRFIFGAGGGYTVGSTGGEINHTLTIAEMPAHTHTVAVQTTWSGGGSAAIQGSGYAANWYPASASNGSNAPHNNMPPYYVLIYCVKTGEDTPVSNSIWGTSGNNVFVQNTSWNVGIGTTSPSEKLNVNGSLRVDNATGGAVLFANATSGKVGIGTTTPQAKLDVNVTFLTQLDQSQLTNSGSLNLRNAIGQYSNQKLGQGFNVSSGTFLRQVTISLARVLSPVGNVWVELYADSGGVPTGSALATSPTISAGTIAGSSTEYNFSLRYATTIGTVYHLVVNGDYAIDGVNYVTVLNQGSGNPYSSGQASRWNGTNWSAITNDDLYFKTYSANANSSNAMNIGGGVTVGSGYVTNAYADSVNGMLIEGNVGIGTTSPAAKLDVNGSITEGTRGQFFIYKTSDQDLTNDNQWYNVTWADAGAITTQGFTHNKTVNSERITVTNSGTYLISYMIMAGSTSSAGAFVSAMVTDDATEIPGSYNVYKRFYEIPFTHTFIAKITGGSILILKAATNTAGTDIAALDTANMPDPTVRPSATISITKLSND